MLEEKIEEALFCCAKEIPSCEECNFNCEVGNRRCYELPQKALAYIYDLKSQIKLMREEVYKFEFYKKVTKDIFEDVFRCVKGSTSEAEYTEIVLNNLKELAKIKYGVD